MLANKLLSNLSVQVKPFALCTVSKGWRLHLPAAPELLVHFVLDGKGLLYGPSRDAHPIAPLSLAVVPRGAKHILESGGDILDELHVDTLPFGDQGCRIVAGSAEHPDLVVGCGIVKVRYGPTIDIFNHLQNVLAVDLSNVPGVRAAFQGVMAEQSRAIAGSDAMAAAFMTQCFIHFFRHLLSQTEDTLPWLAALRDKRLGRVVDAILDKPGADYTVESLAKHAAMSRSAFAEKFAEFFGRSPMNFVNHVRMQRAAQLLAVGKMSVDEIANIVGYSSRSHFSRAFKDHSGVPPNSFRVESSAQ